MSRPTSVQKATPAPPIVRHIREVPSVERTPALAMTLIRGSLLFPSTGTEGGDVTEPRQYAVSLARPYEFHSQVGDISLTTRPALKLWMPNRPKPTSMHTVTCLLDTGAGVNLIHSSMLPNEKQNWLIPEQDPNTPDSDEIALGNFFDGCPVWTNIVISYASPINRLCIMMRCVLWTTNWYSRLAIIPLLAASCTSWSPLLAFLRN